MEIATKEEGQQIVGKKVKVIGNSASHSYKIGDVLLVNRISWTTGDYSEVNVQEGGSYLYFQDIELFEQDMAYFEKQLEELTTKKEKVLNDMEEIRSKISIMNKYKLGIYDDNIEKAQLILDKMAALDKDAKTEDVVKDILEMLK